MPSSAAASIGIRALSPSDAPFVGRLWNESYHESHPAIVDPGILPYRTLSTFTARAKKMGVDNGGGGATATSFVAVDHCSDNSTEQQLGAEPSKLLVGAERQLLVGAAATTPIIQDNVVPGNNRPSTEFVDSTTDLAGTSSAMKDDCCPRVLGFVQTHPTEKYIHQLFVAPDVYGRGVAARLLHTAEERLIAADHDERPSNAHQDQRMPKQDSRQDAGASDKTDAGQAETSSSILAHLHVAVGNKRARRFYDKHGWAVVREEFQEADVCDEVTGEKVAAFPLKVWRMEKNLVRK